MSVTRQIQGCPVGSPLSNKKQEMKVPILSLAFGIAVSAPQLFAADGSVTNSSATNIFPNTKDRISYALGVNFGQNLKNQGVDANLDLVRKGIEEALAGKPQLIGNWHRRMNCRTPT